MNDRFKFRAWDINSKKYLEDFYIMATEGKIIYSSAENEDEVIIEQCTGLKDKNGRLIYEGDIVELTRSRNYGWCSKGSRLVVQWNTFNCCGFGFGSIGNLTKKCSENCIIVGNIHGNKDLLGV